MVLYLLRVNFDISVFNFKPLKKKKKSFLFTLVSLQLIWEGLRGKKTQSSNFYFENTAFQNIHHLIMIFNAASTMAVECLKVQICNDNAITL